MKNTVRGLIGLTLIAALAEAIILLRVPLDPWRLAALLECLALMLGAFVAFTYTSFVHRLRHWALASAQIAFLMPFTLLVPYLILALSTGTFSFLALGKLLAYVGVPTLLLLPDRVHGPERAGWRDFAAMLSLAIPVGAGWLQGIWVWPEDIYVFRPIFCVCVGAYGFLVIRNLKDVGYRLIFKKADIQEGSLNFLAFVILAIPLGLALHFIHPHAQHAGVFTFLADYIGIYLSVAIPEEFLFRGILQNFLVKTFKGPRRGRNGLLVASVIFGLSHLHHAPVPNWRYAILATLAGIFYGNVFRIRKKTSASAFTHAMVDTVWHFWFYSAAGTPIANHEPDTLTIAGRSILGALHGLTYLTQERTSMKLIVTMSALLLFLGIGAQAQESKTQNSPLIGTWDCVSHGGEYGDLQFELHFRQSSDGITGWVTAGQASIDLTSVSLTKDQLKIEINTDMDQYVLTATLKGNELAGEWDRSGQQKGAWEGKKTSESEGTQ